MSIPWKKKRTLLCYPHPTPADLLGCDLVKRLLGSTCVFLSSKRREVVKATLEFVKVTIGVLPADELLPHVEELVSLGAEGSQK